MFVRTLFFGLLTLGCSCGPTKIDGPHGIVGGRQADGYFYVAPVDDGVVVVDTGEDESGTLLLELIAGRAVHAVLVTHAHHDHYGAAALLDVPVYFGANEAAFLRGERDHQGEAQREQRAASGADRRPVVPAELAFVADGDELTFGGETFRALSLAGHTPGSTAWRHRDVLFGGDAAMVVDGALAPIDDRFSDDPVAARAALARLADEDFATVLDGHTGIHARPASTP
jgi:glyoxylase-like metal-dependent hydrolase (beta-lactamase superfamily II)